MFCELLVDEEFSEISALFQEHDFMLSVNKPNYDGRYVTGFSFGQRVACLDVVAVYLNPLILQKGSHLKLCGPSQCFRYVEPSPPAQDP